MYPYIRLLSTDTKPLFADYGTSLYEMDTGNTFYFNGDFWTKQNVTLTSVAITTNPKVNYLLGEKLTYEGMVVTITMSDDSTYVVKNWTTNVPEGTVIDEDKTVTITYSYLGTSKTTTLSINLVELSSISVKTAPTTTAYKVNEGVSYAGLVVLATYDNSQTEDVPYGDPRLSYSLEEGETITENTSVTITLTHEEVSKTCTQALTFVDLSSIAVATAPTKTAYTTDETLTMEGLVLTATFSDATTETVNYGDTRVTYSPAEGTTVTESGNVTITMTMGTTAKTATQAITFA